MLLLLHLLWRDSWTTWNCVLPFAARLLAFGDQIWAIATWRANTRQRFGAQASDDLLLLLSRWQWQRLWQCAIDLNVPRATFGLAVLLLLRATVAVRRLVDASRAADAVCWISLLRHLTNRLAGSKVLRAGDAIAFRWARQCWAVRATVCINALNDLAVRALWNQRTLAWFRQAVRDTGVAALIDAIGLLQRRASTARCDRDRWASGHGAVRRANNLLAVRAAVCINATIDELAA